MAWFTEMDAQGRGQQPDAPLQEAIYCNKRKKKVNKTKNKEQFRVIATTWRCCQSCQSQDTAQTDEKRQS
jgi:hypothetical protein